jgi:biotin-dependent carboxylase-like uncharacterized protein
MDPLAAALANRLLGNDENDTLVEISFGGLRLRADGPAQVAVTGASLPLSLNDAPCAPWTVMDLADGDRLSLGFAETGCRSYLAVRGGIDVARQFGSTATVLREGIGGLDGGRLQRGDRLPLRDSSRVERRWLPPRHRPHYQHRATVRVVPGYQHRSFPKLEQERFFGSAYTVSDRSDRMGYRLEGPAVHSDLTGILSEGIAPGAIQLPPDGQPIVLLRDRQTIGGYPKIGTALSLDCAVLAQLRPGDTVTFTPIDERDALRALHMARAFEASRRIEAAP